MKYLLLIVAVALPLISVTALKKPNYCDDFKIKTYTDTKCKVKDMEDTHKIKVHKMVSKWTLSSKKYFTCT